jgi:LuxR family transcriptional regulator, maltose regulon positive regulatory protein
VIAARWQLTAGEVETAAEYLERARSLVEQSSFPDWSGRFQRCQLEVWLAQNRLRAAAIWADAMLQNDSPQRGPYSETAELALIRVLIVKGDRPSGEQALALLERLVPAAEEEGRLGIAIEALALLALARWQRGERPEALMALERALRLAEPEGYVRLFADLGPPMTRLLQEARSRRLMPDYVATLLAACGAGLAAPDSTPGTLVEPLSRREQEVLKLIAAGLTNREIAETLFISPETVKKHTAAIYGKVGARHRAQAVARARELDLLG